MNHVANIENQRGISRKVAESVRMQRATTSEAPNIHELLTLLHYQGAGKTDNAAEEGVSLSAPHLYHYELDIIPGPELLTKFKTLYPDNYPRIEELTIQARLALCHNRIDRGCLQEAGRQASLLPPVYWQAALVAENAPQPDGEQLNPPANAPAWHQAMLSIETQGDYLRALRNALGISPKDAAKAINMSEASVRRCENGNYGSDNLKSTLLNHYAHIEAAQRESGKLPADTPPLFSPTVFSEKDATLAQCKSGR